MKCAFKTKRKQERRKDGRITGDKNDSIALGYENKQKSTVASFYNTENFEVALEVHPWSVPYGLVMVRRLSFSNI